MALVGSRLDSDNDQTVIDMLDTLGYLREGAVIWTMVGKDFDPTEKNAFAREDFECRKPNQSPFEILSGTVIQRLVDEGFAQFLVRQETDNLSNDSLLIEFTGKGEEWYLREYPRWRGRLHHRPRGE